MNKINLYIYWFNPKTSFNRLDEFNDKRFNVIVGPSNKEHTLLMEKSKYYRDAIRMKKYSFASDVWRVMKLSEKRGLYIDASVILGDRVDALIEKFINYKVVVFRENLKVIGSAVLWSGVDNNEFYLELYDHYLENNTSISDNILPMFIMKSIHDMGFEFSWEEQVNKDIKIMPMTAIRNKNTIFKSSVGSWGKNGTKIDYFKQSSEVDNWASWENKYRNKEEDMYWSTKADRFLAGDITDVTFLKWWYEEGLPLDLKKEFKLKYKNINHKKKISERLIWSIIASAFKSKK